MITEEEKLQIKCYMYYSVSSVQPEDREEKGKFRGDKKEEKRWETAKQERQNPDAVLVFDIIPSALYKSVKLLAKSWQLWAPHLEY